MEFTMVVKEVKLMTKNKGIRIHQYLDDWLVRATSHQTCLQNTQTLVYLCHYVRNSRGGVGGGGGGGGGGWGGGVGWGVGGGIVNMEESELEPKQIFYFVG